MNKSANIPPANVSSRKQIFFIYQTTSTYQKNDQNYLKGFWYRSGQKEKLGQDFSIIGINITLKKEEKDIF